MLIKLTGVPHPDLNGGKPQPIYIDASRVLLIIQGHQTYPKIGSIEANREAYEKMARFAHELATKVNDYTPDMMDPAAVAWLRTMSGAAQELSHAAHEWGRAYSVGNFHPMIECTEVQLACGTALEHGVMLTRVWVSETPEQVYAIVQWAHGLTPEAMASTEDIHR
jgi:hypothetical protein